MNEKALIEWFELMLFAGMILLVAGGILYQWGLMVIGVWFMSPGVVLMIVQRGQRNHG